jgi:hypothetical protein
MIQWKYTESKQMGGCKATLPALSKWGLLNSAFLCYFYSYLFVIWIIEKVGPIWICLHHIELEQLNQNQAKNILTNLE